MSCLSLRAAARPLTSPTTRLQSPSIHHFKQAFPGATQRLPQGLKVQAKRRSDRADSTEQEKAPSSPPPTTPSSPEEKDFWEGDQWNGLGSIASFALPALVLLAIGIGFFASSTYNGDATVFLEVAKSDADTARLYTFD